MDPGSAARKNNRDSDGGKRISTAREPRTFGRYEIEKQVGAGGMGAVYRAHDRQLNRIVALKILPKEKAKNELLVRRFQSEAQAAARLRHENIVGVYDSGEIDGSLFIAMEFIEGVDVQEMVEENGTIEPERSLRLIKQVVLALQHAFHRSIVHRDIKPSNLLVDRNDQVKLADMGLARSLGETESAGITRAGTTVGTIDYMSPEQARDSKVADFRSDIYSLGATWFFMLTGRPPFPDGDLLNKLNAHANDPPPDLRKINPNVPVALVDVIEKMLAKAPGDRFQTPEELLQELDRINLDQREITSDLIASLADGDEEPGARSSKSNRHTGRDDSERELRNPARDVRSKRHDTKPARTEQSKRGRAANRSSARKPAEETRAERDSATSAIPSSRDALLSGRTLSRGRHRQVNVSFDQRKLVTMAVAAGGILIGLLIAWSAFKRLQANVVQPAIPAASSATIDSAASGDSPLQRKSPQKLGY